MFKAQGASWKRGRNTGCARGPGLLLQETVPSEKGEPWSGWGIGSEGREGSRGEVRGRR